MKTRITKLLNAVNALSFLALFVLTQLVGCKKFLDAKPDSRLATPSTIADLQALMDARTMSVLYPTAGDMASDDYYLSNDDHNALATIDLRNNYTYQGTGYNDQDYQYMYQFIMSSNIVLDGIAKVTSSSDAERENVRGQAYFFRGLCEFHLASLFALPYQQNSGAPGIPLKLNADLSSATTRSSLTATYDQILSDLKNAARSLQAQPLVKTRPSKPAAFGLLARTYLIMGDHQAAANYADSALQLYSTLIDYNTVSTTANVPFARYNNEVMFHAVSSGRGSVVNMTKARVDSTLYNSYAANDLRKKVFFKAGTQGAQLFKGDYGGGTASSLFGGIATDEVLLIRAEGLARLNKISEAVSDLNLLLSNRWVKNTFQPYTNSISQGDLLKLILAERRKELLFRNEVRWTDIRRLNQNSTTAKELVRKLASGTYTLPPGSKRFAYLIPESVIQITGIPQNDR